MIPPKLVKLLKNFHQSSNRAAMLLWLVIVSTNSFDYFNSSRMQKHRLLWFNPLPKILSAQKLKLLHFWKVLIQNYSLNFFKCLPTRYQAFKKSRKFLFRLKILLSSGHLEIDLVSFLCFYLFVVFERTFLRRFQKCHLLWFTYRNIVQSVSNMIWLFHHALLDWIYLEMVFSKASKNVAFFLLESYVQLFNCCTKF